MKRSVAALVAAVIVLGAQAAFAAWLPGATGTGSSGARSIGAPTAVTATALTSSTIRLNWTAPAGVVAGGYVVVRTAPTVATVCTVGSGTTTCTDSGLSGGISYSYTVQATVGSNWISVAGAPVSATTPGVGTFIVGVPAGTRTAGAPFNVTLTATTNGSTTDTAYTGTKTIAFSGPSNAPAGNAPNYPATVNFSLGIGTATVTLYAAETVGLGATDGTISGATTPFTVVAAAGAKLGWTNASADCSSGFVIVGNGGGYTAKVSVYDPYNNLATRATNRTVTISQSPVTGTLSPTSLTVPANLSETSASTTFTLPNGNPPNVDVTATATGLTSTVCQVRKN